MLSTQQAGTTGMAGFAMQSFYWSRGTNTSNTQNINVGWEAIGESQLVSYDLESNIGGSYVRLVTLSSSYADALVAHAYINVIPKNSKNFYYRLVYHFTDGSSNMSSPMYADLKQQSRHICLKPSCWP